MHRRLGCLLLLPIATLIACGGASSPPTGTSFTPVSGDYVITVAAGTAAASIFTGDLVVNNTSICGTPGVCGVLRYYNPGAVCVSSAQDIAFTGSYANNVLTLSSASFSNSVATLTIKLPFSGDNVGQTLANGTSVITGGACALASSTLQAQLIPSFSSANWLIALTSPSAATANLSVTESSTANQDGEFPATGTLACGAPSTPVALTGLVSGATLQLAATSQGTPVVTANNSTTPITVEACGGTGTMVQ